MKLITVICTALMAFSLTACARIYTEREQAHILPEESITMPKTEPKEKVTKAIEVS